MTPLRWILPRAELEVTWEDMSPSVTTPDPNPVLRSNVEWSEQGHDQDGQTLDTKCPGKRCLGDLGDIWVGVTSHLDEAAFMQHR